jgi:tetratricopeptide (TPR) repeat protein
MGIRKRRAGFFWESALKLKKNGLELLEKDNFAAANRNFIAACREDASIEPDILTAYEQAILKKKLSFKARQKLAGLLYENGHLGEAQEELEELVEEFPQEPAPFWELSRVYFRHGLSRKIVTLYEKAPSSASADLLFLENAAASYLKLEQFSPAASIYESLSTKVPRPVKFYKILGEIYLELKEFKKAAETYRKILDLDKGAIIEIGRKLNEILGKDPQNAFIIRILGDFYLKTIKPELAVEQYRKLITLESADLSQAAECFSKMLAVYPDYPEAQLALAEINIATGDLSEAVVYLEKLLPVAPQYAEKLVDLLTQIIGLCPEQLLAHQLLAEIYLLIGNYLQALTEIENFLKISPLEHNRAISLISRILKSEPANLLAHLLLARAHLAARNYKKAVEEAENLIKLTGHQPPAFEILGDVAASEGKLEQARLHYQKALGLAESSLVLYKKLKETDQKILEKEILSLYKELEKNPWRKRLHLELGQCYYQLGNLEAALIELPRALSDLQLAVEGEFYLGQCYFEKGVFERAFRHFKKCLAKTKEPEVYWQEQALLLSGFCRENQGKITEALEFYHDLEELEPATAGLAGRISRLENLPGSVWKCLSAYLVGDGPRLSLAGVYSFIAKEESSRRSELKVSFGDTYNNRGFIHFQMEEIKQAEEDFVLAVQIDPELLAARNNLGVVYLKTGRFKEAREILEKTFLKNRSFLPVKNNLAVLYLLEKEFEKAGPLLLEAVKESESGLSWLNLGDLFYFNGQIPEAVFAWEKAEDLTALGPVIKRRLHYLKPERG